MRIERRGVALLAAALLLSAEAPAPFDAPRAWTAFETLLREQYGYFTRPGVDGEAILAAFAPRARAARDDAAFVDTLQLVAANFADPHFVVGPFDARDRAIVPTASDIWGRYEDGAFTIGEVRADGDAAAKGVRPGMVVAAIDGVTPRAAVEAVTGRAFDALSPAQVAFAFDVALAGRHKQSRVLTIAGGRRITLAPTSIQAKALEDGPLLTVERRGTLAIIRVNNSLGNQALIAAFATALASVADAPRLLIDLRATPSGGNTSVARGLLGHFVDHDRPYQTHVVPYEARVLGPPRRFTEYVAPFGQRYRGEVFVAVGHWTGSMGEGLAIGFDAIGATTVGADMADLLGALSNETISGSAARIDIGTEQLFTVTGLPREAYRPTVLLDRAERGGGRDPVVEAILALEGPSPR